MATRPAPTIVNVRFRVTMTREELIEAFAADAPAIAELPGLRWKIWAFDDATREFASVYLFADRAAASDFVGGDVVRSLRADSQLSELRIEVHEVLESLGRMTRAPT